MTILSSDPHPLFLYKKKKKKTPRKDTKSQVNNVMVKIKSHSANETNVLYLLTAAIFKKQTRKNFKI